MAVFHAGIMVVKELVTIPVSGIATIVAMASVLAVAVAVVVDVENPNNIGTLFISFISSVSFKAKRWRVSCRISANGLATS